MPTNLFPLKALLFKAIDRPVITKIIRNGRATIVLWDDGTKTVVKRRQGETDDQFTAVCVAVAKKTIGSGTKLRALVDLVETQMPDMDSDGASEYDKGYRQGYQDGWDVKHKATAGKPVNAQKPKETDQSDDWLKVEDDIAFPGSRPPDWYNELFNSLYDREVE